MATKNEGVAYLFKNINDYTNEERDMRLGIVLLLLANQLTDQELEDIIGLYATLINEGFS